MFGNGRPFWGIDIGSGALKGVRIAHTRQGVQLLDAEILELSDKEMPLSEALSLLMGESLSKADVAIHFSSRVSPEIKRLTLPVMPRKELREAVQWEARKLSQLPEEERVVDFAVMAENGEEQGAKYEIVVVIVERAAIEKQLDSLQSMGLTVTAVDVSAMALLNTARLHFSEEFPENLLYVDMGAKRMEINILRKGVIRFTRQLPIGGDLITATLAQGVGVSPEEAEALKRKEGIPANGGVRTALLEQLDRFIVEIQRSVDYFRSQSRGSGIDKILLMGGMPLLSGFLEYFSSFFDAPVEIGNPFSKMKVKNPEMFLHEEMASRFSLAAGLAMRKK